LSYQDGWVLFDTDLNKILLSLSNSAVTSGWTVSEQTPVGMGVTVAAGKGIVNGMYRTTTASTNVELSPADPTNPRKDLIIINASGTITKVDGTPEAVEPTGETGPRTSKPRPPNLPTGALLLAEVWVAAAVTAIYNLDITDRRVIFDLPVYVDTRAILLRDGINLRALTFEKHKDLYTGAWKKYGAPDIILDRGATGQWDDSDVAVGEVMQIGDRFYMLYAGTTAPPAWQGGLAYADNMRGPWTKYAGNPVLPFGGTGAFDEGAVKPTDITFEGDKFVVWYHCRDAVDWKGIARAETTDWINWTNRTLLFEPSGTEDIISNPSVQCIKDTYYMGYSVMPTGGTPADRYIAGATSSDGVNWTKIGTLLSKDDNPITGSTGVQDPTIVYIGGFFWMVFAAWDASVSKWTRHCLAKSEDFQTWEVVGTNILTVESGQNFGCRTSLTRVAGIWHLLYDENIPTYFAIYLATALVQLL